MFLSNTEVLVVGRDAAITEGFFACVSAPSGTIVQVVAAGLPPFRDVFSSTDRSRVLIHTADAGGRVYVYAAGPDGLAYSRDAQVGGDLSSADAFNTRPFVAATPDAGRVVGLSIEGLGVFDVASGVERTVVLPEVPIGGVAISADGRRAVATAGLGSPIAFVVDLDAGALLQTVVLPRFCLVIPNAAENEPWETPSRSAKQSWP